MMTETTTTLLTLMLSPNLPNSFLISYTARNPYFQSLRNRVSYTSLNTNTLLGKGNTLGHQQSANLLIKLALPRTLVLGKLTQEGGRRKVLEFARLQERVGVGEERTEDIQKAALGTAGSSDGRVDIKTWRGKVVQDEGK